jgi:hypothetical protein
MWSIREQAPHWSDNVGKRIHRLEPESASDECLILDQAVMDIGLRERRALDRCARSAAGRP